MSDTKHVCGYVRLGVQQGDGTYNGGFSIYSAAWPMLDKYPGNGFQSGLFGTWMFADSENPEIDGVWFYSTLEGGMGWWRDTRFATETPKFIMGAVALGFSAWANGPGAGKGRDWDQPRGKYGVAQLSPRLLWPPDGVNLKQGTCGELLGYGYLPLPLTPARMTTSGADVPTGENCWTLFLNAANFKGPVTFVLPHFYSAPTVDQPRTAGLFLDSRPPKQNRTHSMETQSIPWVEATDSIGQRFARMAPTRFPAAADGDPAVLHHVTAYKRAALWDRVKTWLDGGDVADSVIDPEQAFVHLLDETRGVEWGIAAPGVKREDRVPLATGEFVRPSLSDAFSLAYAAQGELCRRVDCGGKQLLLLPEYYQLVDEETDGKGRWVAIAAEDVPAETALDKAVFSRWTDDPLGAYVTPEEPDSCWKTPGPVAGPFEARPGDGSVVTYYWYRFADQPAALNADLSDEEREDLQSRVEKLHAHWTHDREYLAPPATGELAEVDPALIVTPPPGLEIGYVPIATRQGDPRRADCPDDVHH